VAFEVELTPEARRHQNKLSEKVRDVAIATMLGSMSDHPRRSGKPLVGPLEGLWSARRGDFRIVYEIDDETNTIVMLRIQHRADVYRPR
jgi:mRNA interferase RelE/StbE